MAGNALYSALDICGAQFNRLTAGGACILASDVTDGATAVVVSCGMLDITRQEVLGDDRTIREPNGSGGYAAVRKSPPAVEGYNYNLTLVSKLDPELMSLMGRVDLVLDGANTVGMKALDLTSASCYCDAAASQAEYGISMMLWSNAWCGEERRSDYDYVIEAAPKVVWGPIGDRKKSSAFNTITISGETRVNTGWGRGPGTSNVYPEVGGLDRSWAEWLTNTAPPTGCSCDLCALGGYWETGDLGTPLGG